jgi:hypothetical protein
MHHLRQILVLVLVVGAVGTKAEAQTATQSVAIVVVEVNDLAAPAEARLAPQPDTERVAAEAPQSTYTFATNGRGKKITGQLGERLGDDVALDVALEAPPMGSSAGFRTLSHTHAVDLMTGTASGVTHQLDIDYAASVSDGRSASEAEVTRTVIYTVTDR